jgi:hypothetical protein
VGGARAAATAVRPSPFQDWAPEYRPHSIVPPTSIKGDRLRKTFMVSEPMILKVRVVRGALPCEAAVAPSTAHASCNVGAFLTAAGMAGAHAGNAPPPRQDVPAARKTKIVCTLGPSCWSEEGLGALMDAGMNVARFNFSHGDHAGHKEVCERGKGACCPGGHCLVLLGSGCAWPSPARSHTHCTGPFSPKPQAPPTLHPPHPPGPPTHPPCQVLDRVRAVAAAKGKLIGVALDTKGPEIRTAMLKGGKDILLEEGACACLSFSLASRAWLCTIQGLAMCQEPHTDCLAPPSFDPVSRPGGQDRGRGRRLHEL